MTSHMDVQDNHDSSGNDDDDDDQHQQQQQQYLQQGEEKPEEKSEEKVDAAPEMKTTTKSVKLELPVISELHNTLSKEILDEYIAKEFDMCAIDRREKERQDAKNTVEEFVYGTRDKMYSQYDQFATDAEKENISSILTKTEDWLYEDGENESKQVYINKLDELKKLVGTIVTRYNEAETRGPIIEKLGAKIQQVRKFIIKYQKKR